jgi:predicted AAA+ superfamily ATPase
VSGSSARKLKRGGANLLAGRLLSVNLFPLTDSEYSGDLTRKLLLGSLPGVIIDNPQPERTLRSYVHTYLKEEILEESLVRKLDAFSRFLEVAAQYHGKIINATSIAKAVGISPNSALSYFQIMVDTLVAFFLPGWNGSTTKQLRIQPKFYLFDNGVASALRGELQLELTERTSRYGELFECWVVQEMFRMNEYLQRDFKLAYWQTNHGSEVDLVVSRGMGEPLAGIEIKSSTKPDPADFSSLHLFSEDNPHAKLFCFCRTPHRYQAGKVDVLPWDQGITMIASLF